MPNEKTTKAAPAIAREPWLDWPKRLKAAKKRAGLRWTDLAEKMEMEGVSGSGIRHWLNGTTDINLVDFFRLCEAVGANPAVILFGGPCIPADLDEAGKQVVEALIKRFQKT